MIRYDQEVDFNFGHYSAPEPPTVYADPAPIPDATYGLPYERSRETSYGLPYFPSDPGVSRTGPIVSVTPRAALDPNLRAGSLLAGGLSTQGSYRAGRSPSFQRGFTVEMQEKLRRRKRKFWEL